MNDYLRALSIGNQGSSAGTWTPGLTPYHGSYSYGAMPYDIGAYNTWASGLQNSLNPNYDPNVYATGVSGTEQWVAGRDPFSTAPAAVFNPGTAMAMGLPINMDLLKGWLRDRHPTLSDEQVNLRAQFKALRPMFGANRRAGNVAPGTNLMRDIVLGGRSWADASGGNRNAMRIRR